MGVTTTQTNKPFNPRGNDQSPKGYNRAKLYSGKALDFDGVNDYVEVADNANLSFGNGTTDSPFSLHALFKLDTIGSLQSILSKDSGGSLREYALFYNSQDAQMRFFIKSLGGGSQQSIDIDFVFEIDKWYHIVATYDGRGGDSAWKGLNVYVNGILQSVADKVASPYVAMQNTSATFRAGSYAGSTFLNGQISNAKVFNTALTAAQVADLYNNPEKVVPTGVDNTALKLWLPMMEGAGTTAYDGSGNGNHGTIAGATYVNGIGAPVAQSAVMDWNKGSNLLGFSEQLQRTGVYAQDSISVTSNTDVAPNGLTTATTLTDSTTTDYAKIEAYPTTTSGTNYYAGIYVKKAISAVSHYCGFQFDNNSQYIIFDNYNGTYVSTAGGGGSYDSVEIQDVSSEWWRILVNVAANNTSERFAIWPAISNNGTSISTTATGSNVFWGASVSTSKPYVTTPTNGTQPSPVLLPQGLTTGRDITGVNLFENVRKQGALNLDGNSWAEVHDNESLDFGTGSFTLESWVRVKFVNQGSSYNSILTLGGNSASNTSLAITSSIETRFEYAGSASSANPSTEGDWVHLVGTYDETNATFYINGSQADQDARTASNITNALVKHIGRDTTGNRFYNDQIAQPRIYNRALTAEEVQRNYNAGKNTYTN